MDLLDKIALILIPTAVVLGFLWGNIRRTKK